MAAVANYLEICECNLRSITLLCVYSSTSITFMGLMKRGNLFANILVEHINKFGL
ncbi:uncharacterized protein SPAPADRAFT_61916 [Spathaspora passalidarum NRRL Y-27907]|uniref:Uncharacterized protein n=1 Tax=Spathaspora passalidarum (strain NRRL Y-27907 / 11-Y1) TaxID=619300 RepID=G3ART1_SPAPN|nr:uncharacterized protein SPAPADRAFT_61916 [Spathaspora passalidarum NRRL Y-27907]EGW31348.1 hypothetical protein SPAPADRAFT_61916 [Spathaspora passalidarum NRRL Y-27907]